MKKEKGFTLIELLAVIIILAVIALIATPLAINVINNARKNAFKNTAYGLIDAVKLQYAENYLNGNTSDLFYTFPEATGLNFSGERPKGGTIRLTGTGQISIAIYNDKWCAVKGLDASKVTVTNYEEGKCILQEEADVPVITLNGKEIIYMGIGKTFTDPGYTVKTVGGEELDSDLVNVKVIGQTTNKTEVDTSIEETYSITYSITYKEKTDIKTRTIHVGNYNPTIKIEPNGTNDYEKELDVTISVSSHENFTINGFTYTLIKDNIEISTETVDELNKTISLIEDGTYKIKVIAIDSEGNTSEYTSEEYKIDSTILEPNIEATTTANPNGWYKEDIGFNITTRTDASGIKEIKYCKTDTSTSCTPNETVTGASATATIDTESETNYICAISIDNVGNESQNNCSGPYALDKTAPTLTVPVDETILLSAVSNYDLMNGVSAEDSLSQLDGSITTDKSLSATVGDYVITYSVTDKAGNTELKQRTIIVLEQTSWTFTSNGTFTVPATGTYTIEMHGGGGGGGGAAYAGIGTSGYAAADGGAGGGSGEIYTTTLTKGQSYAITIGAGGSAGNCADKSSVSSNLEATAEDGSKGGTTKFGSLYSVAGGGGGGGAFAGAHQFSDEEEVDGDIGTSVGSLASGKSGGSTTGSYGNGGSGGSCVYSGLSKPTVTDINSASSGKAGAIFITWEGSTSS